MLLVWILAIVLAQPIHGDLGTVGNPLKESFGTQAACQVEASNAIKNGVANVVSATCSEQN